MLKNFVKITLRNLLKNTSQTVINIGGLTLGIVCSLVIFLVIQYDLSFDTWHEDGDRVYRVIRIDTEYGDREISRGGNYPMAAAVEEDISGLEYVSIVNTNYANPPIISYYRNERFQNRVSTDEIAFIEPEFFNIFTYEWIAGNKETALNRPNTAVITKSFAEKIFGTIEVIGESIVYNSGGNADLEITGVLNDPPQNSDFRFEIFVESTTKSRDGQSNESDSWSWSSSSFQTYVKLLPGVSVDEVTAQFEAFTVKYLGEEEAGYVDFDLQPLSDIHFNAELGNYSDRVIERRILIALGLIGLFLLVTACINFINLNTAVAMNRSKEVGLRKTLGGTRSQLTGHFLGETALVVIISILLGVGITEVLLLFIEPILGFTPTLNLFNNPSIILFLTGLLVSITLAAGWYPAWYLSSFNPMQAIRNQITATYGKGLTLRRSLIIVQFTITQMLIIGTIIIANQIRFFQSQDLGYKTEAVIEVDLPDDEAYSIDTFKNKLLSSSSVLNVTYSNTGTTSTSTWSGNYIISIDTLQIENQAQIKFVDPDFVDTYGLTILAGENLTPSDSINKFLVNEAFARQVGNDSNFNTLIGQMNQFWGYSAPIIGVVKDFNTQSLHSEVQPTILAVQKDFYRAGIKIVPARTSEAIASIEKVFNEVYPEAIFDYEFLDDSIARMYEEEQRTATIMNIFTAIAIIIGCLGLFGLVSYMATTRTKEIGVRKVLGASITDILKIFAGELSLVTGISFLIAVPVSWYIMQQWLSEFAYRIQIGFEIFAASLGGIILISILTVGYKSMRAAFSNPIESIKTEG